MNRIFATLSLLLAPFANPALAQASGQCDKTAIQNVCSVACGSLCGNDTSFLQANRSFCIAAMSNQDEATDDPVCAKILPDLVASSAETASDGGSAPAFRGPPDSAYSPGATEITAAEDCNNYESRSEQLRCIQNSKRWPKDAIRIADKPHLTRFAGERVGRQATFDTYRPGVERVDGNRHRRKRGNSQNGGQNMHRQESLSWFAWRQQSTTSDVVRYVLTEFMSMTASRQRMTGGRYGRGR